MKVKEESKKVGWKLSIQKTKIMASGPITSWKTDGETVETVSDFIFGGSKITADGDCSHEIKRHLLLGRKVMTNLDSILKNRDITLSTKVHLVKAMVFPVVMYGWSWNSNTLATSCEKLTHRKRPWCWERLGAGGEGDDIGWDGWMASPTQWAWVWVNSGSWWWTGRSGVLRFMGLQRVGHDWGTELNWTEGVWASLIAQLVKNLPAMQETRVLFLGWEDSLEMEMATHSSVLAWKIPWTEEPGSTTHGVAGVRHDLVTKPLRSLDFIPRVVECHHKSLERNT